MLHNKIRLDDGNVDHHCRTSIRDELFKVLSDSENYYADDLYTTVAHSIEEGLYKWAHDPTVHHHKTSMNQQSPTHLYIQKYQSITSNIGTIHGPLEHSLLYYVIEGMIDPKQLAYLTCEQMCPTAQHWMRYNEELEMEMEMKHLQSDIRERGKIFKSAFKCIMAQCGSQDIDYYQKQTRSADEPASTFLNCNVCGKQWQK